MTSSPTVPSLAAPSPTVPAWGLLGAAAAPVLLIGGWTLAAALQPEGFSSVVDTISALAARDAANREVMTVALAGVGVCHLVTAAALRPAAPAGRLLLALGGLATLGVAAFPLPAGGGGFAAHTVTAATAFGALAVWPALSGRALSGRVSGVAALRPAVGRAAAAVLLGGVAWFAVELGAGLRPGRARRAGRRRVAVPVAARGHRGGPVHRPASGRPLTTRRALHTGTALVSPGR